MKLTQKTESEKGKNRLTLKVKLTETEIIEPFIKEYKTILNDERIDKSIREEYYARFENLFNETFNKQEEK